jgi:hypothetical protein
MIVSHFGSAGKALGRLLLTGKVRNGEQVRLDAEGDADCC